MRTESKLLLLLIIEWILLIIGVIMGVYNLTIYGYIIALCMMICFIIGGVIWIRSSKETKNDKIV